MAWIDPITNRSPIDLAQAISNPRMLDDSLGAQNISDLNRIASNCVEIRNRLVNAGKNPPDLTQKTVWVETDYPTHASIQRILTDVDALRVSAGLSSGIMIPDLPLGTYWKMNDLEESIFNIASTLEPVQYPNPITDLSADAGNAQITVTFTVPAGVSRVLMVVNSDHMPSDITDGTVWQDARSGQVITGLPNNIRHYIRVWTIDQYGLKNDTIEGQTVTATPSMYRIWGVMRDMANSSTKWVRTDSAAEYPDPVAAVGAGDGSSLFDGLAPWNFKVCNMVNNAVTAYRGDANFSLANADVMVEIPLSYYRRWQDGNYEYIQISDGPMDGFDPLPSHNRPDGLRDYTYVARYHTSGSQNAQDSKSNAAPLTNLTRSNFRIGSRQKGTKWSLWDVSTWMSLSMLLLVEWADYDTQGRIGQGVSSYGNPDSISSGGTDSMTFHTGRASGTDNEVSVQWRGIENLWGNVYQWLDGINVNANQPYVNKNTATFADGTITNYVQIGYKCPSTNGSITKLGFDIDTPWAAMPIAVGGSGTTYVPDYYTQATGWRVVAVGGYWNRGPDVGLWCWHANYASSTASQSVSSRLLFIP